MAFWDRATAAAPTGSRQACGGFTLVEAVTVLAIFAAVLAIATPMIIHQLEEANRAEALGTAKRIQAAIETFFVDTRTYPARRDTVANFYYALRTFPRSVRDPEGMETLDSQLVVSPDRIDYLFNHLWLDNPGGEAGADTNSTGYLAAGVRWRGPYFEGHDVLLDPWKRAYLVYVRGLWDIDLGADGLPDRIAWILSGGPNRRIETAGTDRKLQGDDVGVRVTPAPSRVQ